MRHFYLTLLLTIIPAGTSCGFEQHVLPILKQSCLKCHGGEKVKGNVDFSNIRTTADADANFELWQTVATVIEDGEMPPEDEPDLSANDKATVLNWYQHLQQTPIEARPATFKSRRLSAPEYRNTLKSLFGFDLQVTIAKAEQTHTGEHSLVLKLLPTDPPGASGFANDTHSAPISTNLWDTYSHLTDAALEKLFSKSARPQLAKLTGTPLPDPWNPTDFSPAQAESLIRNLVPRAFRRPVPDDQLATIIAATKGKSSHALVAATKLELKAVLLSPAFLYRGILMQGQPGTQQPVDHYELAERLSYFLWGDRPDDQLTELAKTAKLSDPETVATQVDRMLASPKARNLAENFAAQWLVLDNLDELLIKDPIRLHALKTQPLDFLNYLFTENRPVMELIDSNTTFANQGTSGFYGKDRKKMTRYVKPKGIERMITQNQRLTLEHAEGRGGILTMPGILTMNHGPIQRGTWMLRRILGERARRTSQPTSPRSSTESRAARKPVVPRALRGHTAATPAAPAATRRSTRWASRSTATTPERPVHAGLGPGDQGKKLPHTRSTPRANSRAARPSKDFAELKADPHDQPTPDRRSQHRQTHPILRPRPPARPPRPTHRRHHQQKHLRYRRHLEKPFHPDRQQPTLQGNHHRPPTEP